MPVPGTFAELTTKRKQKYYTGDFWCENNIFVLSFLKGKQIAKEFGKHEDFDVFKKYNFV